MPIPPKQSFQFVCPQCNWRGPVQTSDVFMGPIECPTCQIKLVSRPVATFDVSNVIGKISDLFKR